MAEEFLKDQEWRAAGQVISNLEQKYGEIEPVLNLRYALNLMRGTPDAD